MDTTKEKKVIERGMIVKARYSKIEYTLNHISVHKKGKSIKRELHFKPLEETGIPFRIMEQDFLNNSVFIIKN